jgi:dipeptidyl aminopeptidase/acylaminoacyl peptidase
MRRLLSLSAVATFSLTAFAAGAQQAPATPVSNANANLPFGATSADPVSKWTPPASAGRQLTLNDLLTWKAIRNPALSNDGKWFVYIVAPNEGDAEVVLRGTAANAKETRFPIGDATAAAGAAGGRGGAPVAGASPSISGNNKWVAFLEYASGATGGRGGRGGRGGGGGGAAAPAAGAASAAGPKLAIVELATGTKREFESVRSFRFASDKSDWLAVLHSAPAAAAAAGGAAAGGAARATGTTLELVNLSGGTPIPIGDVSEFAFDESGDWLAYAVSSAGDIGNSVQVRQLSTSISRPLDVGKGQYRRLVWSDSTDALAAIRAISDTSGADEDAAVVAWTHASRANDKMIEITAKSSGVTGGLVVSSDRAPEWGEHESVLYFGLRDPRPPRPRATGAPFVPPNPGGVAPGGGAGGQVAAAPQTDAEVPSLILWHWKDPRPQPQQQVQEAQDRAFSYAAAFHVANGTVTRLADETVRNVTIGAKDNWAIGTDITPYERDQGIKGFAFRDIYAINVNTGERKLIDKKVPGNGGGGGRGGNGAASNFSPDGGRYLYYHSGEYKIYDFASGTSKTITTGVPAKFWDTEDDHNEVKPAINGALVGWSKDGSAVYVRDNWDVWRLPTSGTGAVNITGNGLKDQIKYQARSISDPKDRGIIDPAKPLYFETYGEWTKKEGLVQVDPVKGGVKTLSWENAKVDYRHARDADMWVYTRQTVVKHPDWYAANGDLSGERQLTDANPQQKDVAWTPGAKLIDYTCENGGGHHQGVLYLPAGYEQGKKYPMLTYIYEKLSQEYNVYTVPNETRYSNPSVYTNRGYAFFKPDIVYHVNDPGRSAVWCVVPAVKAAIATGIVDPARVGLQGHSWGGYQTTFITTQTKIFKTAVAGAPLTDMVSMFGSIYWNSGSTDASIFIASQGRFTGGPNEVPEAYTRNSPQNFAQNLSIPFMLLSNDRDGAVDFNQGVTYYNHLRDLGKDVILLEYAGENHGLARPANMKDYNLRMTEWFDTFLRDQPAPDWLKDGVPRLKMEEHLKQRRPLVDPKAAPVVTPKIVP